MSCEPYAACIKHTTVEDTLTGECAKGYMVRFACTMHENLPDKHAYHSYDWGSLLPSLFYSKQIYFKPASADRIWMHLLCQGWSCSECAASFYRSEDATCSRCNNYVWILYIIAFFGSLVLVPTLLKVSKSQGFMSVNILISTLQVMASCASAINHL